MRDERTIQIEIGDESLSVTYKPSLITPASEDAWLQSRGDTSFGNAVATKLSELITKWDLLSEDGELLPIDADTLCGLPISFLNDVMRSINEDLLQKKVKKESNSPGSFGRA